jgi:hypothetical protein
MAQIFQPAKPIMQLTELHLDEIQLIELQENKNTPSSVQTSNSTSMNLLSKVNQELENCLYFNFFGLK